MLSQRRIRLLLMAAVVLMVTIFYYSGDAGTIQNQRFYRSTVAAIDAHREAKEAASKQNVQPQKPAPPKPVEENAKPVVQEADGVKAAIPKGASEEMEEIPIAGRTKMTVPKNRNQDSPKQEPAPASSEDDPEAKNELNAILKRSPIVIFSKSYCPYSKRAKTILLEKYNIVPAPHVVELDQHAMGQQLQSLLAKNTGRRTVPNVLVNGKSIGGGDDVTALDEKDELASTLKNLGGKWIQEVNRKDQKKQAE
ncbi:glutaredoxin [Aspergillus fischeri NRRL 181]|uniref:Glutaredoxin domain protein n=1 Tax=Neosartorya fischeri (strain ATCC 1020 / DSM 3700 / CBS 544.65 / FGSC A1164 / JCM 1740 / NRRL 181 / WB 181) TaxID=331117 RepID=A1D3G6_NEOFI|nr:Glutaredoxin domain protein [Aspergillus fischeri NRRL 181]EAW22959.1 Glutaredoxin domain protein [Aspergillus fischeri NRRL 181]